MAHLQCMKLILENSVALFMRGGELQTQSLSNSVKGEGERGAGGG